MEKDRNGQPTKYALYLNTTETSGQNTIDLDIDYPVSSMNGDNETSIVNSIVSVIFDPINDSGIYGDLPDHVVRRNLIMYIQEVIREFAAYKMAVTYEEIIDQIIFEYEIDEFFESTEDTK